ncbi:ABC transporter substrate-binding protein [Streptomyces boninensis]|uniref:ABC transporter substrate-binding protein n=1 Tax=Streptomyces boninensis TaxID=2039455 RepID=UPI003B2167AE
MISRPGISKHAATALIVGLALTASACGGSDGGGSGGGAKGKEGTKTGKVREGGRLVVGQTQPISQIDPNTINAATQQQLMTLLWNGLTKWGPGDTTEPDLATSWKSDADYKNWTFKLRDGVKFHDGSAFTADDAVKNINRILEPKTGAQVRAKLAMIDKATAEGKDTLKLKLKEGNPNLPTALIELKMTDVDDIKTVNKTANGTGPFKLTKFVPDQTVDLARNDAYWGTKAHLKSIRFARYADPTAAETAFRSGEVHVLYDVPADSANTLQGAGNAQVIEPKVASSAAAWELDTQSEPFDDPRARQALSYAVDRKAMLDAAYGGHGVANTTNTIVNPDSRYAADSGLKTYKYDLQKAKKLFAAAGVKSGDKLTFWTSSGYPSWQTMGEVLQSSLQEIGIKLEIKKAELATWSAKFYPAPKKFPGMIVANYLSFPNLPATYSLVWFGKDGTCECKWKAPDAYNKAVTTFESTDDDKVRGPAYDEAQRILSKESPIVVIGNTAWISVAQPQIRNVWAQGDGAVHLESAGFAK